MTKEEYEEYFADVETIAQDIVDMMLSEAKDEFYEFQDDFPSFNDYFKQEFVLGYCYQERLHDYIDGSQWMFYTARNHIVVQSTNNIDAWTEIGSLPRGNPILGIAYSAMMADVSDKIDELVEAL